MKCGLSTSWSKRGWVSQCGLHSHIPGLGVPCENIMRETQPQLKGLGDRESSAAGGGGWGGVWGLRGVGESREGGIFWGISGLFAEFFADSQERTNQGAWWE